MSVGILEGTIIDFGFDARLSAYHFVLVHERNAEGVRLEERFADDEAEAGPARGPVVKAMLDAYRWSRIAEPARQEFNRRLTAEGGRPAKWRLGETLLAPHLGKELVLLMWVVEDSDPTLIPNMVTNWLGLAPEERWWLYTTINATAGHPEHGRDRGWRKAVKIALAENPALAATPGGWLSRGDVDRPELSSRPRRTTRGSKNAGAQLSLLPEPVDQLTLESAGHEGDEG